MGIAIGFYRHVDGSANFWCCVCSRFPGAHENTISRQSAHLGIQRYGKVEPKPILDMDANVLGPRKDLDISNRILSALPTQLGVQTESLGLEFPGTLWRSCGGFMSPRGSKAFPKKANILARFCEIGHGPRQVG